MNESSFIIEAITVDITFEKKDPYKLHIGDFQELMVVIGQNGSGKTMFLTCTWFVTFLMASYQTSLLIGSGEELFGKTVNDSLEMTFDGSESLTGLFIFSGKKGGGFEFILQFEQGKLVNFNIEMDDPSKFKEIPIVPVKFNSKDARQFSAYDKYLTVLEMTGINRPTTMEDFKKVSKMHKLFDILWFENIRITFERWEKKGYSDHAKSMITNFHSNWPSAHDVFGPNPYLTVKEGIPYIVSDTIYAKLSSLGSGHQSVLMTFLFLKD